MRRLLPTIALLATFVLTSPATACPVCDRETGRQVRAGIFDGHFAANVLASAAPFGIFYGLAALILGAGRPRGRGDHA